MTEADKSKFIIWGFKLILDGIGRVFSKKPYSKNSGFSRKTGKEDIQTFT